MMSFHPSSSDDSGNSGFSARQDMYLPASRTDGTYWITDSVTFPSGLVCKAKKEIEKRNYCTPSRGIAHFTIPREF